MIKRFMKWLREQEGQEFGKKQYPKEVEWITTTMKENRVGYSKELLTFEDVLKLSEAANNLRDRAFVLLLYESGVRIGEILSIRIKDVVFEQWGAEVCIPTSKSKPRTIFVHRSAPAISNWLMDHPDRDNKNSFLFCGMWSKKRGEEIDSQTFRYMLQDLAKRAKINKPVNPHNFRHSRATELADSLTNAQLCNYLGWQQGSRELRTYISMKDTKDAILKMNGIEKKDDKVEAHKPVVCPRCGIVNSPDSKFCSHCSLGLELQSVMDYEKTSKETLKTIDDPKKMQAMLEVMIKRIEQLEKEKYEEK
jgi:integrase/recombinase XerD